MRKNRARAAGINIWALLPIQGKPEIFSLPPWSGEQAPVDGKIIFSRSDEPAVSVPEVAKQHDVFVRAIAFGVLVNARASF